MSANDVTLTVSFLNGELCTISTCLDATLGDVKAKISKETGHSPWSQRLSLGATPLEDSSKPLKDLGVTGASPLSLVLVREPIGQSNLAAPNGMKESILKKGDRPPKESLNEFEFMSWQAVCASHNSHGTGLCAHRSQHLWTDEDSWPVLGAWGLDLYDGDEWLIGPIVIDHHGWLCHELDRLEGLGK